MHIKNSTWKDFADHLNKDVDEVKKKIKNLRTSYVLEKKKVDNSVGASGKSTYEPRLFYYDEMTFLDPVIVLRILNITEKMGDPLYERSATRSLKTVVANPAQKSDPLTEKRPKRLVNSKALEPPKKIMRFDYEESVEEQLSPLRESTPTKIPSDTSSSPIDRHTSQITTASEDSVELSKEQTFCAMLCSELKLLNSEDVYDNVTAEIFSIVKNAKVAERQIIYQPEEDGKHAIK
ncbi:uncharacterized protein [Eurosta solidaginis]|uniref:uncharacterized protein isoform X2 n=1 Tax=Eurosta solidaginis TaxID=178769 RepID=UPI00353151CA